VRDIRRSEKKYDRPWQQGLPLGPDTPEIAKINIEAVSILWGKGVVVDNALHIRYRRVEFSTVEFALGQRPIELRQVALGIVDSLKIFAARAGHTGCPPEVLLNPPNQGTDVAIAAALGLGWNYMDQQANRQGRPNKQKTDR